MFPRLPLCNVSLESNFRDSGITRAVQGEEVISFVPALIEAGIKAPMLEMTGKLRPVRCVLALIKKTEVSKQSPQSRWTHLKLCF